MTQEEKAKRYDEAIKKAKGMHKQGMMPERLEHIFPELKESKYERNQRIKKEIVEMLHYYHSKSPCFIPPQFSLEETLAWLEKQGEQKPAWSEDDEDALDIAIRIIQNDGDDCAGILDSDKALKWLKSLKERVQQPK